MKTRSRIGGAAAAAGQILLELRESDGAGLEELFFQLTSPTAVQAA
jgi:ABC-2 type transport system ATP-binding protein